MSSEIRDMSILIASIEEEKEKNLDSWGVEELKKLLEGGDIITKKYYNIRKTHVKKYLLSIPIPDKKRLLDCLKSIHFEDVDRSESIRKNLFEHPGELAKLVDKAMEIISALEPEKYLYLRAFAYSAWCGISAEDLLNVRVSDFLEDGTGIVLNDKTYAFHDSYGIRKYLQYKKRKGGGEMLCDVGYATISTAAHVKNHLTRLNSPLFEKNENKNFYYDYVDLSGKLYAITLEEAKVGRLYDVHEDGSIRKKNHEVFLKYFPNTTKVPDSDFIANYAKLYDDYKKAFSVRVR